MSRITSLNTDFRFCEDCGWEISRELQRCRGCLCRVTSQKDFWSPSVCDLTAWFARCEFWFAHLWLAQLDIEQLLRDLNVPLSSVDSLFDELWQERTWPVAEIPLRGGYSAAFVYFNYPEDADGPIYFDHPNWPEPICIGRCGGNFQLPALRGEELQWLTQSAIDRSLPPWQIYLLFFPGAIESGLSASFADALGHISTIDPDRLQSIIAPQFEGPSDIDWSHQGWRWVSNWHHSRRNPDAGHCLSAAEFDRIERMFDELKS